MLPSLARMKAWASVSPSPVPSSRPETAERRCGPSVPPNPGPVVDHRQFGGQPKRGGARSSRGGTRVRRTICASPSPMRPASAWRVAHDVQHPPGSAAPCRRARSASMRRSRAGSPGPSETRQGSPRARARRSRARCTPTPPAHAVRRQQAIDQRLQTVGLGDDPPSCTRAARRAAVRARALRGARIPAERDCGLVRQVAQQLPVRLGEIDLAVSGCASAARLSRSSPAAGAGLLVQAVGHDLHPPPARAAAAQFDHVRAAGRVPAAADWRRPRELVLVREQPWSRLADQVPAGRIEQDLRRLVWRTMGRRHRPATSRWRQVEARVVVRRWPVGEVGARSLDPPGDWRHRPEGGRA